jgi:uncharacterized protein (DUF433 family)
MARSLTLRQPALLWVTEWGVWPSSENWHLYYKLRQTYSDHRLLQETPGHLFLEHEAEDLASFLQIAMLNGWGGHLLTHSNYVNAFFSHDEYIDPEVLTGKPVIRGTRLAVEFILELVAAGESADDLLASYPGLTREDILACRVRSLETYPANAGTLETS